MGIGFPSGDRLRNPPPAKPSSPSPAPQLASRCSFSRSECQNAWQLGQSFSDGTYHYDQLDTGHFSATASEAILGPVQIIYENINRSVYYQGRTSRRSRLFVVRADHRPEHYVNGRIAGPLSICLEPVKTSSEAWCPGGLEAVSLAVDEAALLSSITAAFPHLRLPEGGTQTVIYNSPLLAQRLIALSGEAMSFAQSMSGRPPNQACAYLAEAVLECLTDILVPEGDDFESASRPHSPALTVARAHEYIHARLDTPLTVINLCRALRVSRRALQRSFVEVTGVRPTQYLLQLRLNRVHRDLVERHGTESVHDVAMRWGFWHMSRFAGHYRRAFGALPSATRRSATPPPPT
jgi:AraC family transcriptional regulator, ethanolamine operon transcriptional activator